MKKAAALELWFVDDLKENLDRFTRNHRGWCKVRTFSRPEEVLKALESSKPDALFCDIFFYETEVEAKRAEGLVGRLAQELKDAAHAIHVVEERHLAGVDLMETLQDRYKKSVPFPYFAYTSKGPYLLEEAAWERIAKAGGIVLFKGKYGKQVESAIIRETIERFQERHPAAGTDKPKVLVVHGKENKQLAVRLKSYLQNTLHADAPKLLARQEWMGAAIIRQLESAAKDADVVFVFLTPEKMRPTEKAPGKDRPRRCAGFELGYLTGKLESRRGKVVVLAEGDAKGISDRFGVRCIDVSKGIVKAGRAVKRELSMRCSPKPGFPR